MWHLSDSGRIKLQVFHEIIKENFVSPVPFIVKGIKFSVLYHDASQIFKNEGKI